MSGSHTSTVLAPETIGSLEIWLMAAPWLAPINVTVTPDGQSVTVEIRSSQAEGDNTYSLTLDSSGNSSLRH
jgi:hypothetical protein